MSDSSTPVSPRRLVVVLGMHRSGTSLLAHLLTALGVELGDRLLAADANNPAGYWEQADITRLQDALMGRLAGDWRGPAWMNPFPLNWESLAAAGPPGEVEQLKAVVRREMAAVQGLFGFKDPRTSRLLPLWKRIFSDLAIEPIYLLALRHPSAVAASLRRRDQLPAAAAEWLWLLHNLEAVREAGKRLRGVVDYDRWFTHPLEQAQAVARALHRPWPEPAEELMAGIRRRIRPDLCHGVAAAPELPFAGQIYALLQQAAAAGELPDEFHRLAETIEREAAANAPWVVAARQALDTHVRNGGPDVASFQKLPSPEEFDEARYLECNPDVAEAVRAGRCRSGWQHFVAFGRTERRRWFRRSPVETSATSGMAVPPSIADYDILVPIYNAPDDVRRCVESLVRHTEPRHQIYLLDDASPDGRIAPLLRQFAEKYPQIHVLTAPQNAGFVANVNRGFALSRRDVVILNSDTEVTPGWLDRLDRCRRSDPAIGIVSPLSNNATILSVPQFNLRNTLPPGMTPDRLAALVAAHSQRLYPKIPTAVGFCMLITRETLDAVGGFDPAFGLGYGEENDFCLRAWAAGKASVACDDAYVHHYGEASFRAVPGIDERRRHNAALLQRRWPQYASSVYRYCQINPLRQLQETLRRALAAGSLSNRAASGVSAGAARPHVLQVIHNYHAPGGTELHTREIVQRLSPHFRQTVVFPGRIGLWADFAEAPNDAETRVVVWNRINAAPTHLFLGQPGDMRNPMAEENFRRFVAGGDYDLVHFQHLAGWSSLRLPRIAKELGKRCVLSVHDYFLHCPQYVLLNAAGERCGKIRARADDPDCLRCLAAQRLVWRPDAPPLADYLQRRERLSHEVLKMMDAIVAPSEFVRRRLLEAFGEELAGRIHVIPHGVDRPPTPAGRRQPVLPLRVGVLGTLNYQKGLKLVVEAAAQLNGAPIRLEVFGAVPPAIQNRLAALGIREHGGYRREQLPALLGAVDLVLIPSLFDETFCLTLSEAQALGIAVLASAVGAIPERIADGQTGFLFSPATGAALAARLLELARAPDLLSGVAQHLRRLRFKTLDENAQDYAALYQRLLAAPAPTAVSAADLPDEPASAPDDWLARLTEKPEQTRLTSILILTWNQLEHTRRCVASLAAHTPEPHEIIFVDNGSTDGTVAWLREYAATHPHVRLIENRSNRGFAGGNNQALALARGEFLVLLNNDTVVTPGWLGRLLRAADAHPDVGLFGPMSNSVSGPQRVPAVPYRDLDALDGFAVSWGMEHVGQVQPVSRLVGFCLLLRRRVLETIGGLDERFGKGNFEDDDFCIRARLAGFGLALVRDAFVHHVGGQTFQAAKIAYRQALTDNWRLFREKWKLPEDASLEHGYPMPRELPPEVPLKIELPLLTTTHQAVGERGWREKTTGAASLAAEPPVARLGRLDTARAQFAQKNYSAAWSATVAAIAQRPFHPEAYLLLAEIALAAGDPVTARRCAQHARHLAPHWNAPRQFLKRAESRKPKAETNASPGPLPEPDGNRLSVCLIVKNEEKFLAQCLESIRGLAQQIVVVDTGSTDRTVEIARSFGAEVHSFPWNDDFSAARNAALEFARGDWVLVLDADEELPASEHARLRADMQRAEVIAFRLPLVNCSEEAQGRHYVPRLFRNAPGVYFYGRVHEQVFPSLVAGGKIWGLKTALGTAELRHHGYAPEIVRDRRKIERNLKLLRQAVREFPHDANLQMNLGLELVRSGDLAAGLAHYRQAFRLMSAQPPEEVAPELREVLLLQFTSQLHRARAYDEIVQTLHSPLARQRPLSASLCFALGLAHFELKQFAQAAAAMRQCLALRHQPSLAPANTDIFTAAPHHCLALSLMRAGDAAGAEKAFRAGLAEAAPTAALKLDYAKFLAAQNQPLEALKWLTELVTGDARCAAAWRLGGDIALSRPSFLEFARDWTAEAIRQLPDDNVIVAQRAEALLLSQQAGEALPLWARAVNGERPPRALAAHILCATLTAQPPPAPRDAGEELAVSRAFVDWYRRLVNTGARETIVGLNSRVETLRPVLPSAATLLDGVIAAAGGTGAG